MDVLCGEIEPARISGDRTGETGVSPAGGLMGTGADLAGALPLDLSSSFFLPNFQKSLFRGLVEVSPAPGSRTCLSLRSTEGSFSNGEADSLDSVLGAALLSLIEDSFADISLRVIQCYRGVCSCCAGCTLRVVQSLRGLQRGFRREALLKDNVECITCLR